MHRIYIQMALDCAPIFPKRARRPKGKWPLLTSMNRLIASPCLTRPYLARFSNNANVNAYFFATVLSTVRFGKCPSLVIPNYRYRRQQTLPGRAIKDCSSTGKPANLWNTLLARARLVCPNDRIFRQELCIRA